MAMDTGLALLNELPEDELEARVKAHGGLPRHIAIIMDGNGRWAQHRRLPRVAGHRAGRHAVRRAVRACASLGVEFLTLYTFSQENWKRPSGEVSALWSFLEETIAAELRELAANRVRLMATGELGAIPARAREALDKGIAALAGNDGLVLNLALAYGGRQEIVRAASRLAQMAVAGAVDPTAISEADLRAALYAPELPDPDLLVRTSGELRLSNFLLWQLAYTEIHVTPVLWPDFQARDLLLAVADYQNRERRFGDVRGGNNDQATSEPPVPLASTHWKRLLKVRP